MNYPENKVEQAFRIYARLANAGSADKDDTFSYKTDSEVRSLLDLYANCVDCVIIDALDVLHLVPVSYASPFHITNEAIKKEYFAGNAVNLDIYMMYLSIIILVGEFYDSYQTDDPTRDFIAMEEWLECINERMESLRDFEPDQLRQLDLDYEYNWSSLLEKWEALDEIKENVKQTARTQSRMAFLLQVRRFLADNGWTTELGGDDEITLTEKAHIIIQRYFKDEEYNRGILEFLYALEHQVAAVAEEEA